MLFYIVTNHVAKQKNESRFDNITKSFDQTSGEWIQQISNSDVNKKIKNKNELLILPITAKKIGNYKERFSKKAPSVFEGHKVVQFLGVS